MAGQRWTAAEALDLGLVDRVVEPDALEDMVGELAADALGADRAHVAAIKAMFAPGAAG